MGTFLVKSKVVNKKLFFFIIVPNTKYKIRVLP